MVALDRNDVGIIRRILHAIECYYIHQEEKGSFEWNYTLLDDMLNPMYSVTFDGIALEFTNAVLDHEPPELIYPTEDVYELITISLYYKNLEEKPNEIDCIPF